MDYAVIAALIFVGAVLFGSGFFVGRVERSSARLSRTWEPTEHGGRPL